MANVADTANALLETLKRDGIEERGQLKLVDQADEAALVALLCFLSKKVSVYTLHHEITIKKASHVL